MNHLDENELVDFTQGVLPPPAAAEVEAHLDCCPACRSVVAELIRANSVLAQSGEDTPVEPPATDPGQPLVLHKGTSLGRYVILERLGAGGMGVVYGAYDPQLDRKVSLKLLRPDVVVGSGINEGRARLLREAQAMARLSHPNVVTVHDVGTFGDQVFVAMELVEGGTLSTWLRDKPRPWLEVLDLFVRAGRGLAAAHAAGLVHRDFKPDNVLVGRDGRVRVTDFGLARPAASTMTPQVPLSKDALRAIRAGTLQVQEMSFSIPLTQQGALLGTPAYMAPEQLQRKASDARTDQFSFCIALYEGLYGERPFEGDTLAALASAAERGQVRAAPSGSAIPASVRKVLLRGLAASPEERFPSMEALLEQLERRPRARRGGRWPALAGGGLAVALVATGAYVWQGRNTRLCEGAGNHLEGVWDLEQKTFVQKAFLATGVAYAEGSFGTVARTLDVYAASWVARHTEACEATRVRGEQSDEVLTLRMACLRRRLDELGALARVLSQADPAIVERSVLAVSGLTELRACDEVSAWKARVPLPEAPAARAEVERLRRALAEAKALTDAGRYSPGGEIATRVAAKARALRYRPLEAEALVLQGEAEERTGHVTPAVATLLDAVRAAEAGRHDEVAARAWSLLAALVGLRRAQPGDGLEYAKHAEAAIEALGGDDVLTARLGTTVGAILQLQGKAAEARERQQRALALQEKVLHPDHPDLSVTLNNLANALKADGRHEESLTAYRRAVEIARRAFGDAHPRVATLLNNLGGYHLARGELDQALALQQEALRIREFALPSDHADLATSHNNLAATRVARGEPDAALAHAGRAVEIRRKALGAEHPLVASALSTRGDALRAAGRLRESVEQYREAAALRERALGAQAPELGFELTGLGQSLLALRRPADAVAPLERALTNRAGRAAELDVAETRFALARALAESGRDLARARALASAARDAYARGGEAQSGLRREVEGWLSGRAGPR